MAGVFGKGAQSSVGLTAQKDPNEGFTATVAGFRKVFPFVMETVQITGTDLKYAKNHRIHPRITRWRHRRSPPLGHRLFRKRGREVRAGVALNERCDADGKADLRVHCDGFSASNR